MLKAQLRQLVDREPFEPFRIRLVNGDVHDIFHPQNVAVQKTLIHVSPPDQNWFIFPINKIASVESLFADFTGELTKHEAP